MNARTPRAKTFEASEIEAQVAPMLIRPLPSSAYTLLQRYLVLLLQWNQKMNLTGVRDPGVLVGLHLGECLRAAQRIPEGVETVLDFGSGAGLPGIPIQIARPDLRVTLAESQKKKAAFLREAVRELGLTHASVHAGRVEALPAAQTFDLVTLRAVDKAAVALEAAIPRIRPPQQVHRGWCMVLTSLLQTENIRTGHSSAVAQSAVALSAAALSAVEWLPPEAIPATRQRVILLGSRSR